MDPVDDFDAPWKVSSAPRKYVYFARWEGDISDDARDAYWPYIMSFGPYLKVEMVDRRVIVTIPGEREDEPSDDFTLATLEPGGWKVQGGSVGETPRYPLVKVTTIDPRAVRQILY